MKKQAGAKLNPFNHSLVLKIGTVTNFAWTNVTITVVPFIRIYIGFDVVMRKLFALFISF